MYAFSERELDKLKLSSSKPYRLSTSLAFYVLRKGAHVVGNGWSRKIELACLVHILREQR